jgi:hypothetical protein
MARCDKGYLCDVCGEEVEEIVDSELYLRYVMGEVATRDTHPFAGKASALQPCHRPVHC